MRKEDSTAVGCLRPVWKQCVLQFRLPPSNVAPRGVSPKMYKFEQVSSNLMSEVDGGVRSQVWCLGVWSIYHVTYPMMYLMLPTPFPHLWTVQKWRYEKVLINFKIVCSIITKAMTISKESLHLHSLKLAYIHTRQNNYIILEYILHCQDSF